MSEILKIGLIPWKKNQLPEIHSKTLCYNWAVSHLFNKEQSYTADFCIQTSLGYYTYISTRRTDIYNNKHTFRQIFTHATIVTLISLHFFLI